jgi:hypothetical protein
VAEPSADDALAAAAWARRHVADLVAGTGDPSVQGKG